MSLPIWSCSVWGLPCRLHYCRRGGLLPHPFTLTSDRVHELSSYEESPTTWGGLLSVALAVPRTFKREAPDVIRHTALRSSDFPPPLNTFRPEWQRSPGRLHSPSLPAATLTLTQIRFLLSTF